MLKPVRFVRRRVFAGALSSLLALECLTFAASVNAASAVLPTIVNERPASDDIGFIELSRTARRADSFPAEFNRLRARLAADSIVVEEQWVSPSHLYLRVRLPRATILQRNTLVEQIRSIPGVAQVFTAAAAPGIIKNLADLQKHAGTEVLPESKLRGFREKRQGFQPNVSAPHTGEILVKYLDSEVRSPARAAVAKTQLAALHARLGARAKREIATNEGPDRHVVEVIQPQEGADFAAMLQAYLNSPLVEFAQPNYRYQAYVTPNDTDWGSLWGMDKIQAPAAWDTRTDASSVVVAIADTGIDYNHPDIAGNMWNNPSATPGYDGTYGRDSVNNDDDPLDDNAYARNQFGQLVQTDTYHGTHVSGTVGAVGNNSQGVTGVAWGVKLMAVKVLNFEGAGSTASIIDGLDYARTRGASIINASLGWPPGSTPPNDHLLRAAVDRLNSAGVVLVNAAGNFENNNDNNPTYPANYNTPIQVAVGGSDPFDGKSVWGTGSGSHWGQWSVDVFAPGSGIYSTRQGNRYHSLNGTSMATPHVTGMLALAKAHFPWESGRELADRARFSSDFVGALGSLSLSGGRINASKSLSSRSRLSNLSTRCQVNTGDEVAIGGIIVTGPGAKRVAFRAQGPTLANFGLTGVLANPQITIKDGSGVTIGFNDDWGSLSSSDQNELINAGAAPADSLESAWVGTLSPGSYTVILEGVSGGTGIGIIESFDLDGSTQNRLYNVSTRCYVGTGQEIAIAGTVTAGDKDRTVYIRALGPTLTSLGVANALQDPVITLYDQNGTPIASNDDWGGGSTAFGNRVVQAGMAPGDSREPTLIYRLSPSQGTNYTVGLSGKNGSTGVAIIEVFEY